MYTILECINQARGRVQEDLFLGEEAGEVKSRCSQTQAGSKDILSSHTDREDGMFSAFRNLLMYPSHRVY